MQEEKLKYGAYTREDLFSLINKGRIKTLSSFKDSHVSVASIDVTVEDEAYEIEKVLKPLSQKKEKIRDILNLMNPKPFKIGDTMYPGKSYIAKASLDLDFTPGLYMYGNAKSSSGRNFLLVRMLADEVGMFDGVDMRSRGYTGELWMVFEPLVYPIILTKDETYLQIRVLNKDTRMNKDDLDQFLIENNLLYRRQNLEPYSQDNLSLLTYNGSILTTIYAPANQLVGYRVKENILDAVDLTKRDIDGEKYFEKVYAKELFSGSVDGYIELKQNQKYLLCTNEVLKIPTNICSELKALDPRLGLFFSHFAGFFDPGFFGTGTLEVIPMHDMVMRAKDPVARFEFEYLREDTDAYGVGTAANYQGQIDTKLPKQFKNF